MKPSLGTVESLAPADVPPPDLHDEVCNGKRHAPASDEDEDTVASSSASSTLFAGLQPPALKPADMLAAAPTVSEPVVVYTGPTKTGASLIAAVAADTDSQTPPKRRGKARKTVVVAVKKNDGTKEAKVGGKTEIKPAAVHHANAKPEGGAKGDKAAAADAPSKPAKPKAVAKPKSETKPPKSNS